MTESEAIEVAKLLAEAYPAEGKWSPERVSIWVSMLTDLPAAAVQASAKAWITTEKWPPSIAEIRELATGGGALPSAADAWGEVMALVRGVGSWGVPVFSSGVTGRAVEAMGGWQALCASENAIADRAHFLKIFDQLAARERRVREIPNDVRWLLEGAANQIGRMPQELDGSENNSPQDLVPDAGSG